MPGRRFSAEEREEIRVGLARGESLRGIARRLGRAASSVCREVSRNAGRERYQATAAERRAQRCRARPKQTKFQFDPTLARRVENRLAAKDSPMTIARALAAEGSPLSHETIYRAIYAPPGAGGSPRACTPTCTAGAAAESAASPRASRRKRPARSVISTRSRPGRRLPGPAARWATSRAT